MIARAPAAHSPVQAIPDHVGIPVSRHTTWKREDIISNPKLEVTAMMLHNAATHPPPLADPS